MKAAGQNGQAAQVAIPALDRVLLSKTMTTEQLHRIGTDLHRLIHTEQTCQIGLTAQRQTGLGTGAGTPEQQAYFLPRMLSGEDFWCQGYSEPGSGSDLVSLQTYGEAVSDPVSGDHWVVNGQKIWTSYADKADWIFCLVRTDTSKKHEGISFVLIDMRTPGVETRPILLISGSSPFCETFFTDVKVPKENMLGDPGQGFRYLARFLAQEVGDGGQQFRRGGAILRHVSPRSSGVAADRPRSRAADPASARRRPDGA